MFTLRYPATGSADTVELPSPKLGDTERSATEAIARRTIGGDLLGMLNSDWPQVRKNIYDFENLDEDTKDELLAFLENYAGLEIGITDHNSVDWIGVIISPENEVVTVRDACVYDVSFEFLGEPA